MFFILSKLLALLLNPVFIIFIGFASCLLLKDNIKRLKARLKGMIVIFFIMTNPWIINSLMGYWEINECLIDDQTSYKSAIVLGGFSYFDFDRNKIRFSSNSDRIMQSMLLFKKAKVSSLIISGGSGFVLDSAQKESIYVKEYLVNLGFNSNKIKIDTLSRNTNENAQQVKNLLQKENSLNQKHYLVTSAYHMRRAKACFKKRGLEVIPYSTDYKYDSNMRTYDKLVPSVKALENWKILLHEVVGLVVYKFLDYA